VDFDLGRMKQMTFQLARRAKLARRHEALGNRNYAIPSTPKSHLIFPAYTVLRTQGS
jgi:hypothetical protein